MSDRDLSVGDDGSAPRSRAHDVAPGAGPSAPSGSGRCATGVAATVLLAGALGATGALFSGAPWLESRLAGTLTTGNALAALALGATAGAAVALEAPRGPRRLVARVSLASALAWLPLSIGLAGNLELNFGSGRGTAWLLLTLMVAGGAAGSVAWGLATRVRDRRRRRVRVRAGSGDVGRQGLR